MKATTQQQDRIRTMLVHECNRMNLSINAICTIGDCWILVTRYLISVENDRPTQFGNARDWLLTDLDDSHIETVFRSILPKLRKA